MSVSIVEKLNRNKQEVELLRNNLTPEQEKKIDSALSKIEEKIRLRQKVQDAEIQHLQEIIESLQQPIMKEMELVTLLAQKIQKGETFDPQKITDLLPNLNETSKQAIEADRELILKMAENASTIANIGTQKIATKPKEKNNSNLAYEFARKNPALAIGALALGTFAVIKTYKWVKGLFGGKKKEKEKDFIDNAWDTTKNLLFWGGSFFVAGKLIGKEKFVTLVKNLTGTNLDEYRLAQIAQKMSEGKFVEAWNILLYGANPDKKLHEKIEIATGISQKTLFLVARSDKTYAEWMIFDFSSFINYATQKVGIRVPLLAENPQIERELADLKKYLKRHENLFSAENKMDAVLRKVFSEKQIAKLKIGESAPPPPEKEPPSKFDEAIKQAHNGDFVGAATTTGAAILGSFKKSKLKPSRLSLIERNAEIDPSIAEKEKVILKKVNTWIGKLETGAKEGEGSLATKYIAGIGILAVTKYAEFVIVDVLPVGVNFSQKAVEYLNRELRENPSKEEVAAEKFIAGIAAAALSGSLALSVVANGALHPIRTIFQPIHTIFKIGKDGLLFKQVRNIRNLPDHIHNVGWHAARNKVGSLVFETPGEKYAAGRLSAKKAIAQINKEIKLIDKGINSANSDSFKAGKAKVYGSEIRSRKVPFTQKRTPGIKLTEGLLDKRKLAEAELKAIKKSTKSIKKLQQKHANLVEKGAKPKQLSAINKGIENLQKRAFKNPDLVRGLRSRFKNTRIVRYGKGIGKIAGGIGVLSLGVSVAADVIEQKRLESNLGTLEQFEKNNKILDLKLSDELQKAVDGEIDFEKVAMSELTIERKHGTQIIVFEKGWTKKIIIKDKKGGILTTLKIPEGLRTPIEEILTDVKQKAAPKYIEVDLTHPKFLIELQNTPMFSKVQKYLEETKTGAKQRGLKICVNKHSQNSILFIDKKSEIIKNKISIEALLMKARGGNMS
jgi:hypothetical protein